jgi:hypothetical protein
MIAGSERRQVDELLLLLLEYYVGILEQSTGSRNRVGIRLLYRAARLHRLAGLYNNLVPTRFPVPIDCSKIPTLYSA